jgi:hypothetical protein
VTTTSSLEVLAQAITAYAAGLDAELDLLGHLESLSARQRDATASGDVEALNACSDERLRLTSALVALEQDLKPLRGQLADHGRQAAQLPGFSALVVRHQEAARRVAGIVSSDERTMAALRDAEAARRFAAQTIDAGEATLAAYRRVVAPPPASAAIVDERG